MKRGGPLKRKKALARGGRLERKTPMRRVSAARAEQSREYLFARRIFLDLHPYCQWWLAERELREQDVRKNGRIIVWRAVPYGPLGNTGGFIPLLVPVPRSNQIHHKNKRRGPMLLDEKYWMAVSAEGHRWIEEHKAEARRKGYLLDF